MPTAPTPESASRAAAGAGRETAPGAEQDAVVAAEPDGPGDEPRAGRETAPGARQSTAAAEPGPGDERRAGRATRPEADVDGAADKAGGTGQDPGTPGPERSRRRSALVAAASAATIILGAFGGWAAARAHSLNASAAGNLAVTDSAATAAVKSDVTRAVQAVFSYNYADTARTRAAAQRLLTGRAIKQYDQLFALVERQAPAEKLVVATTVTNIGVELMTPARARLLVFADQQDTRAGTHQSSYAGAMFAVTAVHQQGTWKIENIDTFSGG